MAGVRTTMNAKKRYFLVLITVAFLAFCYYGGHRLKDKSFTRWKDKLARLDLPEPLPPVPGARTRVAPAACRMETCFNLTRCRHRPFKVYVYPTDDKAPPSESYSKVLNTLIESHYYTPDPDEACLFVLSLDTLDRDPLSNSDYVRGMPKRLESLPSWNGGLNHVIFNLMAGTYPDYTEDLGFDTGKAILAKASMSDEHYRPGFDVSIPLFQKNHPERGGEPGRVLANNFPVAKKHFLAFKGKRYVYGIGSETRNSFYHLHNGKNIILVTTCKHGKYWKELQDERCDEDNKEFDRWDFDDLLSNSTFCLVPRGRRLGSYRFIETLQAGCVPVLLSNGWRLPFAEVIDWSQAALQADERLLLQVPDLLHSVPQSKVFAMRQQTQILWERYLSSVEKIVHTTLEIIRERVHPHRSREGVIWNSDPGALWTRTTFSDSIGDYPFDWAGCPPNPFPSGCDNPRCLRFQPLVSSKAPGKTLIQTSSAAGERFTAVIYSQFSSSAVLQWNSPLFKLVRNVAASQYVDQIVVLWTALVSPPPPAQWPGMQSRNVPLHVIPSFANQTTARFQPSSLFLTSAILSLDDDSTITTDEIDFAFSVWKHFPERIVGFPARSHYWDERRSAWAYTSRWTNDYSMVLTGAAFLHRYYLHLFTEYLAPHFLKTVDQASNCEDILMNFLVSHVTRRPPIKVTQRKMYKDTSHPGIKSPWNDPEHFADRQSCLNTFVAGFGYMPLLKSSTRFDPILFKDPVSNFRKKYRKLELVPIASGSQ